MPKRKNAPPPSTSDSSECVSNSPRPRPRASHPPKRVVTREFPRLVFEEMRQAFMDAKDRSKPDSRQVNKLAERASNEEMELNLFFSFFKSCIMRAIILSPASANETKNVLYFAVELIRQMQTEYYSGRTVDTEDEEDEETVHPIIEELLFPWLTQDGVHDSKETNVRLNVTRMIAMLLKRMPENTRLELGVFERITSRMLERIKDKVPAVRIAAVDALERLQNPRDLGCPVLQAYEFHSMRDPSWTVRRAAVKAMQQCFNIRGKRNSSRVEGDGGPSGSIRIPKSHSSYPACRQAYRTIIDRTRDEHPFVRKEAFTAIAERIAFKAIKVGEREILLRRGLGDRHDVVKNTVKNKLVFKWIDECQGILNVLSRLNVVNDPDAVSLLLQVYFDRSTAEEIADNLQDVLDEQNLIPLEKLSPHLVFYWAEAMKYMRKKVKEEEISIGGTKEKKLKPYKEPVPKTAESEDEDNEEAALKDEAVQNFTHNIQRIEPLPTPFSVYFEKFATFDVKVPLEPNSGKTKKENNVEDWKMFMQLQLVNVCRHFNYSDGAGRRNIGNALKKLLAKVEETPRSMVQPICKVFPKVYPNHQERLEAMLEVVSDIRVPLDSNQRKRAVSVQEDAPRPPPPVPGPPRPPGLSEAEARKRAVEHKKYESKILQARIALEQASEKMLYEQVPILSVELAKCCADMKAYEESVQAADEAARRAIEEEEAAAGRVPSPIHDSKQHDGEEDGEDDDDEVVNERTDPVALIRALDVMKEILFDLRLRNCPDSLNRLQETFAVKCMQNLDLDVRNAAIIVIGQCCLLSMALARRHLGLLMQITQVDADFIIDSALRAVFDILLRWGQTVFEQDDRNGDEEMAIVNLSLFKNLKSDDSQVSEQEQSEAGPQETMKHQILDFLLTLLGHDDSKIRALCAQGLTKLMLVPAWASEKVLARLLLTFYNPAQPLTSRRGDLDVEVHQILAAFFTFFSLDPGNRDIMEGAFFRTMRAMFNAPVYSPLAAIKWDDCASTMLDMLRNMDNRAPNPEEKPGQESLAFKLLGEMNLEENYDEAQGKFYSKMLNMLELPLQKYVAIRSLAIAAKGIKEKKYWSQRPIVARNLGKFIEICDKILAKAPADVFPDCTTSQDCSQSDDDGEDREPADSMVAHASRDELDNTARVKPIKRRKTLARSQVDDPDGDVWEATLERNTTLTQAEMKNLLDRSNAMLRSRGAASPARVSIGSTAEDLDLSFEDQLQPSRGTMVCSTAAKPRMDRTKLPSPDVSQLTTATEEDEDEEMDEDDQEVPGPAAAAGREAAEDGEETDETEGELEDDEDGEEETDKTVVDAPVPSATRSLRKRVLKNVDTDSTTSDDSSRLVPIPRVTRCERKKKKDEDSQPSISRASVKSRGSTTAPPAPRTLSTTSTADNASPPLRRTRSSARKETPAPASRTSARKEATGPVPRKSAAAAAEPGRSTRSSTRSSITRPARYLDSSSDEVVEPSPRARRSARSGVLSKTALSVSRSRK